ncbi:hypothetical protein EYC55_22960 [Xanthomonas oryzae]|uniref:hypothetical protein n=1 Tax=Xanthomonas oryzae TaxID=347 RepID=UPI001033A01E|nr:hypothetical protein [Xanthomonas oryzae]QBG97663.1 hypothetical protein EYC55_22960 [Xanthomonas oryzae]
MTEINRILRLGAVPLSSGIASVIFFSRPISSVYSDFAVIFGGFGLIGAIIGFLIGCPIVLLVDWRWSRFKCRYVVAAVFGALFGWLLLEGAFAKNAWKVIWTSAYFWLEYAPRRISTYSFIGLLSGLIYTFIVNFINKFYPEVKEGGN